MWFEVLLMAVALPSTLQTESEKAVPGTPDKHPSEIKVIKLCDAECFCKAYDANNVNHLHMSVFTVKKCVKTISIYYPADIKEDEDAAESYTQACYTREIDYERCTQEIIRLKPLGYNMKTAAELINEYTDGRSFKDIKTIGKFQCRYDLWNTLRNIKYLNVMNCVEEFTDEETEYFKEQAFQIYADWNYNNRETYCSCFHVLGIGVIVQKSLTSEQDISEEFRGYFEELCLTKESLSEYWKIEIFVAIAKLPNTPSPKDLKSYLDYAAFLLEAGWFKQVLISSTGYIKIKDIQLGESSKFMFNIIKLGIEHSFSTENLLRFFQITDEDFYSCRMEILNAMFVEEDNTIKSNTKNEKFYEKQNIDIFIKHLELFIKMYVNSHNMLYHRSDNSGCKDLINNLRNFRSIFYKTSWSPEFVTDILTTAYENDYIIETVLNCLKFFHDLDEKIDKEKWLKNSTRPNQEDLSDYSEAFTSFRKSTFLLGRRKVSKICNNYKNKYPIATEVDVIRLMSYVLYGNRQVNTTNLKEYLQSIKNGNTPD